MKGYSVIPKAPALPEPHHPVVYCHIKDTCWGSLTPLQWCSRCILQPQENGKLPILLSWSWKWWTTRDYLMPSIPDTFLMVLGCASMVGSTDLGFHGFRSIWSHLVEKVLATRAKFLEQYSYCTVIHYAVTFCIANVFSFFPWRQGPVETCKAFIPKFDFVVR